jgi:hypothetical protein
VSRQLREIRLSRLSFAALAALSVLVTVVIISGGGDRSSAELAAAAALQAHPVHVVTGPGAQGAAAVASAPSADAASPGAGQAGAGGGSASGPDAGSGSDLGSTVAPSEDGTSGGGGQSTNSGGSNGASNNGGSNTTPKSTTPSAPTVPADLPKIRHVFEIALSTTSYASAFGPSSEAAYLRSLVPKGTLLSGFHSLGSGELADNLALVSGQGPDPDTAAGCTKYAEFPTGVTAKSNGLVAGNGCVYPETALTIGDQVSASGHVWRAYIADMGKQACAHPNSNAVDDGDLPGTEAGYDTAHNPFIYFHSLLDLGDCATDDQDLSRLQPALAHASGAPTFSFIAPGQCEDASLSAGSGGAGPNTSSTTTSPTAGASAATTSTTTTATTTTATSTTTTSSTTTSTTSTGTTPVTSPAAPTACPAGQPTGLAGEDAFLRQWVPRILAAPSYRAGGMLLIVFGAAGEGQGQQPQRTGALVLSRYARRGKTIAGSYGPYSVLRTIEQLLAYTPLAHAKSAPSFAAAALRKHG